MAPSGADTQWPFEGVYALWTMSQLGMTSALEPNMQYVPRFIHAVSNKPHQSTIQA